MSDAQTNPIDDIAINDPLMVARMNSTVLDGPVLVEAVKFYAIHGNRIKNEMNQIGAESHHRQDKVKFLNGLMQDITDLIDTKETLDISKNLALQDKLNQARSLGVRVPMDPKSTDEKPLIKTNLTVSERDKLVKSIEISIDEMDKDGKIQMQKMQVLIQESDRYLALAHTTLKDEKESKRNNTAGMKG